jgi:hypothetical protein
MASTSLAVYALTFFISRPFRIGELVTEVILDGAQADLAYFFSRARS